MWQYYDGLTDQHKPTLIRGDVFLGNEGFLVEAEKRSAHYLTKLRLTANVKKFITKLFNEADWVNAGHGFEGAESTLKLTGWSKSRRVVVLRRALSGDVAVSIKEGPCQLPLFFLETPGSAKQYEYAVLVTSLPVEILSIAQLYRDRADSENCFDELKNQWGWGGYTTQDLKRCRLVSRLVALVYNWWSLFVRLACPQKHFEAITSRPLLLHGVAKQTTHAGQTTITISSSHAKSLSAQSALQAISGFLAHLKSIAEQLHVGARMRLVTRQAFHSILDRTSTITRLLPVPG